MKTKLKNMDKTKEINIVVAMKREAAALIKYWSLKPSNISKKIKATPEFIFHRVRMITQKYPNVQFLFVNGRKEATRVVERIFTSGCAHEKHDLQLAYDMRKL